MRVNDVGQFLRRALHLQRHYRFGNQLRRIRPDDVHTENLAVLRVGNDLDESLMLADDAGPRVRREGELADLHLVSRLLRIGFGHSNAADLRMTIRRVGDPQRIDLLRRLARNVGYRNDSFHRARVCQLRQPGNDVANGVDARLRRAHIFVDLHKPALHLDLRLVDADVVRNRRAANRNQNLLRLHLLLLAVDGERHCNTRLRLLNLLDFGIHEAVDSPLAEHPHEFLRDFLVFNGNIAWQHFQNRHLGAERLIDAGKLHAHRARPDHDERLGNGIETQDFDVGKDLRVRLQPRQHARHRAGSKDDVLGFDLFLLAAFDRDGVNAILCRAGQFAASLHHVDLVLARQKRQPLRVLVDDSLLALLDRRPVQRHSGRILQSEFRAFLHMVVDFGIEQQRLGGNAADVQTGAPQLLVLLDERRLQAQLSGAKGRGVSGRSAADDGYVINCFRQVRAPVSRDEYAQHALGIAFRYELEAWKNLVMSRFPSEGGPYPSRRAARLLPIEVLRSSDINKSDWQIDDCKSRKKRGGAADASNLNALNSIAASGLSTSPLIFGAILSVVHS